MINKREIDTFCQQYGREPIRAPSARKKKIIKKQNKIGRKIYRKPYNKNRQVTIFQQDKPTRKPKYKKFKNKENTC